MAKRIDRHMIEHWRDGECIGKVEVTEQMVKWSPDACRVVLPPSGVTLTTGDELHFDIDGLIERLTDVRAHLKANGR